jgi:hypothetical protein
VASHIVVVAAPPTDDTAGLIGAEQLAEMREDACSSTSPAAGSSTSSAEALESGWTAARCSTSSARAVSAESPLYDTPNSSSPRHAGRPTKIERRSTFHRQPPPRSGGAPQRRRPEAGTSAGQVTIVGLPGSGKTTVFNALTGGHAETGGFSGSRAAPNVSVVKVPDVRVDRLSALFNPKKTTYADVTYVDVAIPAGAAREGTINPDVLALSARIPRCCPRVRRRGSPSRPTRGAIVES